MHSKKQKQIPHAGFGAVGIIGLIAVVLIVGGVGYLSLNSVTPPPTEDLPTTPDDGPPAPDGATPEGSGTRLNDAEGGSDQGPGFDTPAGGPGAPPDLDGTSTGGVGADVQPGTYQPYSEERLALAEDGTAVLFFHATWCPTCRAADADITENAAAISPNTHILKVDYDTATDLRQRYGVTTQHTFVQVDADGNELQQWTGSRTLADILAAL